MLRIRKNELFLVLVVGLVLVLSCAGYAQQAPTKEKIIRVAQSWPCYIDPAVGQDNVSVIAHINLYEQLVMLDEKGEITPKVAKSWDFDPASNTYTFHLVEGIKFHNGDILTANDVIFSLERLLNIGEGWSFLFKNVVGGYSAPNPETVVISLEKSYGPFLSILIHLHILNEKQIMANIQDGLYEGFGDYGKGWLVTHDAGSGPYQVKEMKTAEYLYAVRFPDYWGGWDKDAPDSFKLIGTTEPVTVRTLMSRNQLEITDEWQPTENYEALGKIPGVEVAYFNAGGLLYLDFNTSKPPLDDVHFRRALMYIFDYKTCHELVYPMGKRTNGPVGSALPGWDSTLPFLERDIERAKMELAQSKYANQLDKYPVEFAWVSEVPDEEKVALLLQSNASEIGIKIEVSKNPWLTMVARSASAESTPHIFTEIKTSIPYPEAGALLEGGYHSIGRGTFANVHWFTDEIQNELDQLIEGALSTASNIERYAKYSAMAKRIIDIASDIWAVELPQRHAYHADYVVWSDADAAKVGEKIHIMPGQRMYFKDMKFVSEKVL
ncbi:putative D,D-dipeptide-binding periplasmic protein DdpA [subsurface metagenome]